MTTLAIPAFLDQATTPLACRTRPELFHAPDDGRTDRGRRLTQRLEAARDACLDCPLMLPCRDWGRTHHEIGIWGGETEEERTAAGYPPRLEFVREEGCGNESGARRHRRRGERVCDDCAEAEREAHRQRHLAQKEKHATLWPPELSRRERQCLELLAQGLNLAEISQRLGIRRKSASGIAYQLRTKLRTDNEHLVDVARGAGLLPTPATEYEVAA